MQNWVDRYDADMSVKQTDIDAIEVQYRDEQEQLRELEARLAVLQVEYDVVLEEHRIEVCQLHEIYYPFRFLLFIDTMVCKRFLDHFSNRCSGKPGKRRRKRCSAC